MPSLNLLPGFFLFEEILLDSNFQITRKMSDLDETYVFTANTLSLFDTLFEASAPGKMTYTTYDNILSTMFDRQKAQYRFWLSLSNKQQGIIRNKVYYGPVIVSMSIYNIMEIEFDRLGKITEFVTQNQINNFAIIDHEYIKLIGKDGQHYLIKAHYDPATNQIIPYI